LKVLHVYSGNLYGGVEALLVALARYAALEPSLVHEFAVGWGGRLEDELVSAGSVVHRYPPPRLSRPWTVWQARQVMSNILADSKPDVVIVHSTWPHVIFAASVRKSGLPLVYWLHDTFTGRSLVERLSTRTKPDFVIANSRYNGQASLAKQFPGVPWEANPSASPAPRLPDKAAARARIRLETNTANDATVILQSSRLERWKGHTQLLSAAAQLRDRVGWEIWFCGGVQRPHEQAFQEELKALATAGGILDRVKFLGQRTDMPEVLASADIHCQPNLHPEPLGLTFVEALYASLPCVSMDMGGAAEIITKDCGILLPPGDVDGLASALRTLVDDPARRATLGAAGPARARDLCDPALHLSRLRRQLEPLTRGKHGPNHAQTSPLSSLDPVS
jgi:glycosyltransferase involved in cell wall biosynthesis